jgi:hypothetical protein
MRSRRRILVEDGWPTQDDLGRYVTRILRLVAT